MKIYPLLRVIVFLAIILSLLVGTGYAYVYDDLSSTESGVYYYDEELDPEEDELMEIELELLDHDGRRIGDDVYFYIESSAGRRDIDFYYDVDKDYPVYYERDDIWRVETDHRGSDFDGRFLRIWVEPHIQGEIDLYIGKEKDDDMVTRVFTGSRYDGELTLTAGEPQAEHYQLNVPEAPVQAGTSYDLEVEVFEYEDGPSLRDQEITFYERKTQDSDWEEITTETTDRDGIAWTTLRTIEVGSYEYTAKTEEIDKEHQIEEVTIAAADPYDIEALQEEILTETQTKDIYFRLTDRYDNINKDIESGIANYEDFRDRDLEDFDYTERLEITVTDPDGEEKVYEYDEIEYSKENKAMYTELDLDEYGKWEIEGRIKGTSISAATTVEVAEFGELEEMELDFHNQVMRNLEEAEGDYNFQYYQDNRAKITLIDEDGVRMEYDPEDEEIFFGSDNTRVVSIGTRSGELDPNRTGSAVIDAYHQETGMETKKTLHLADEPADLEVETELEEDDLLGTINLTMVDENGIRTVPGEFKTSTENDSIYAEEFQEDQGYYLVTPDEIEIIDESDFLEGKASFEFEAEDYGEYTFRVYTDYGPSKTFEIELKEEEK